MNAALTAREREVASLVAEGLTNREIAERLVISERTAEYHVEQIRNKLGVRSRAQVAAWMSGRAAAERREAIALRHLVPEPPASLVGRDDAFGACVAVVNAAIDGRGGALLAIGEPGAGKTRLLAEIARLAESSGVRVLRGAAGPAEGNLAYQPWSEALAVLAEDATALGPPWSGILATLLPEVPPDASAHGVPPELRRTRLFEAVARLLARAAGSRAVALLLDDLHDADADSLELLHYVVRTVRAARVAVAGTARPAAVDTNAEFTRLYRTLVGAGLAVEVPLAPLGVEAVASLLAGDGMDRDRARDVAPAVHEWAGGNPFLTLEAARLLRERGALRREGESALPDRVRHVVLGRLDVVPEESRRALEALAVLAKPASLRELAAVRGRHELVVAEAMGPAIRAGIVRELSLAGAPGVRFAHELIREAMYQQLPATTRAALHGRIAITLRNVPPSVLAHHLTRAGQPAPAVEAWIGAGDEAARRFAYDAALESYRNALGLLSAGARRRAEVEERVGEAELARGAAQAAIAAYDAALRDATDAESRLRLSIVLAFVVGRYEGTHPRALELARDAVATLELGRDNEQLARGLVALAWMQYRTGEAGAAEATGRRVLALARALDLPRVEAAALEIVTRACWLRGDHSAGPSGADVEPIVARLGDDADVARLRWLQATALVWRGELESALAAAEHGLAVARRVGSIAGEVESAEPLMWALVLTGRYRDAVTVGDAVLPLAPRIGLPRWPRAAADFLHALVLAGEDARALELALEILRDAPSYPPSPHVRPALFAVSALTALGRCDRATAVALAAERPSCEACAITWLQVLGRSEAVCGDPARAAAAAEDLEGRVASASLRIFEGTPPHIRALAHARAGRREEAERAAAEARARYDAVGNVGMRDLLLRELGRADAERPRRAAPHP